MKFERVRAVVTGASGGIGQALAAALHGRGASVLLVGRNTDALERARAAIGDAARVATFAADLTVERERQALVAHAVAWDCNLLVNNAGLGDFALLEGQSDAALERLFAVNTLAPMQLTRALLPHLRTQPQAAILNMGSVFGSLGYPGYSVYSASKFALRGFTEALRREYADTNLRVLYLAPRSTRTSMNATAVERMNAELGVAMDPPADVAAAACALLAGGRLEAVLGWP
ncbi:MAG: SDR family oxidoreductase, partial [Steroidobacteraceae bacterium]